MRLNLRAFFDEASSSFSYLVDDGAGACAVIDPVLGFDPAAGRVDLRPIETIVNQIEAAGLALQWILETHVHADRLSAAHHLQRRLGGKLGIGANVVDTQRHFGPIFNLEPFEFATDGSQFDRLFVEGDLLRIGGLSYEVMHVPGHTPADLAYYIRDPEGGSDAAFVGDSLSMPDLGTARCDFPGGDPSVMHASIRRILSLPPNTRLYVGHDFPPEHRGAACVASVQAQRLANIHVRDSIPVDEFVAIRKACDAALKPPPLLYPSVQVNLRAGRLPSAESNGRSYLKIPLSTSGVGN